MISHISQLGRTHFARSRLFEVRLNVDFPRPHTPGLLGVPRPNF